MDSHRPTWWWTFTGRRLRRGTARIPGGSVGRRAEPRGGDWRAGAGARRAAAAAAAGLLLGATVHAGQDAAPSGLGRAPTAAEAADRIIGPDGADLPPGSGDAAQGELVFGRRGCSTCHGPTGAEGPSIPLVGGDVTTRTNYWPIRHWPFAPSIWDYIHRVMPYDRPGVLTNDETYAVTAYLLYRNGIIGEHDVMDARSLPRVRMPRRGDYAAPGEWTPDTRRGFEILPAR